MSTSRRTSAHMRARVRTRPEEGKTNGSLIAERVDARRMIEAVRRLSDDALNEELRRRGLL